MTEVAFDGVSKVYRGGTNAVNDLDLEINDGEFMVLVGPSGCGKTTALRMVAGLEEVTAGEIRIGDRVVNDLEPMDRDVAMVFQNYALYPHMTVEDNIAFALRTRRMPKDEIRGRVDEMSRVLGLRELLKRKPRQLSGGQRQRVAMGRAIVRKPSVFLMDEPLSNLDAKLRVQMRAEVARIQRELGVTTIYVTHDQVEAMTMGDRIAVMSKGRLHQVARPQDVYDRPAGLFVASFIGSPPMNLLEAQLTYANDTLVCKAGDEELLLPAQLVDERPQLRRYAGRPVGLGIRPEHVHDPSLPVPGPPADLRLRGEVRYTESLGAEKLVHLELNAKPLVTEEILEVVGDVDATAAETLKNEATRHRTPFVARFDVTSKPRPGDHVEIVISSRRLHFFDLDTGTAIDASSENGGS